MIGVVVIQMDPRILKNPDADLRYVLPDTLIENAAGQFGELVADGYDYIGDAPLMDVYITTNKPEEVAGFVIEFCRANEVMENEILNGAHVGWSLSGEEPTIVYQYKQDVPFLAGDRWKRDA